MSRIYSANQYEDDFKPRRLGNWEIPKQPYGDRPKIKRRTTRVIADDKGHLLAGVPRPSGNPFEGLYIGTYQLPKRITRQVAEELSRPRKSYLIEKRSRYTKPGASRKESPAASPTLETTSLKQLEANDKDKQLLSRGQEDRVEELHQGESNNKQLIRSSVLDDLKQDKDFMPACLKEEHRSNAENINQYQPNSKTDDFDYSHHITHDTNIKLADLPRQAVENCESHNQLCRLPPTTSPNSLKPVENSMHISEQVKYPEIVSKEQLSSPPPPASPKTCKVPPLMSAHTNSQFARTLKLENQKHHPLPDIIEDALYRSLQFDREKNPGLALNTEPKAAAIGCKCYGVPGPTQCSKLRVYRPKTAGNAQKRDSLPKDDRPKTSSDRGTREKENFTEMELALCWDYHPKNTDLEPKRPTHIDGSNGSAAPSVFTLVHPIPNEHKSGCPTPDKTSYKSMSPKCGDEMKTKPRTAWDEDDTSNKYLQRQLMKIQERSNPSAVMNVVENYNGSVAKENDSPNVHPVPPRKGKSNSASSRGSSKRNSQCSKEHCDSIKNNLTLSSDLGSLNLKNQKHYCSSPNLTTVVNEEGKEKKECKNGNCGSTSSSCSDDKNNNHVKSKGHKLLNARPCMACSNKSSSGSNNSQSKPEYKMAFKAGKPNGFNGNGNAQRLNNEHKLHIPKPKTPFAKRSYSIGTLVPPFSLWPGTTGQDYPEHWRLASVYQHSYKPIQTRRKPFLRSVYQ
ncbi:uncharacterized protein [Bemisia tabaci]|uniref:uncharacterized protein n=1 Tax=Bemisia tabaci TaxID=7038 RepID=UPI003B2812E1